MAFRRITDRPTTVTRQTSVRPLALRWTAWAERLLRRHAPGSGAWYALNAVLRQNAAARRETRIDQRTALAFGLYLTIPSVRALLAPPGYEAVPTRIVRAISIERITALTERARTEAFYRDNPSPLAVLRQPDLSLLHTHTLAAVERIYARQGRRYESWGTSPGTLAQVVRPPEARSSPSHPPGTFGADSPITPLRYGENAALSPALPLDVGRLTDQVIASIDQRLTLTRERYGRR